MLLSATTADNIIKTTITTTITTTIRTDTTTAPDTTIINFGHYLY